jgi:mono/diheme cytochrome c family protein
MKKENKGFAAGFGIGIVAVLLVQFLMALVIANVGAYDIAASRDHTPLVRWMLDTTMENSVKRMASDVGQPPQQPNISAGGAEYKAMCEHCHGGPNIDRAEWAQGLLPLPPHLTEHAEEWETKEIFWLAKHGIKATGMPSFGATHDDTVLWNIATFVKRLPGMTKQEYASLGEDHAHHH